MVSNDFVTAMHKKRTRFSVVLAALIVCFTLPVQAGHLPQAQPAAVGMDADHLDRIDALIPPAIERGDLPGCVVLIARQGQIVFHRAYGHRQVEPEPEPMTTDTVFDLASLTKPIATATSIMLLVERGEVRLRNKVAQYVPEFGKNGKESITVEQLLTHHGGLIPDNSLDDYLQGVDKSWQNIYDLKPRWDPGTQFKYTDVGFMMLGDVIEKVTGKSVHEFSRDNIFAPLGMSETGYLPAEELHSRTAPTEKQDDGWLRGEVHDPRASALGGVAGHAGLFSTSSDLAVYAQMMLGGGSYGGRRVLSPRTVAEMTTARDVSGSRRGLGWDMRSGYSSNRGELMSDRAFGHGGFTGTAIWIDPQLELTVIFLSNRLHPDGVGSVNELAGRIGTIAAAAIRPAGTARVTTASAAGNLPRALLGIDVLKRDKFAPLAGRRVGLITNHTGVDSRGVRTIDLLHEAAEVELVALFSPEHGIAGTLDQPHIEDARDEATGLSIYSLYGESRRPNAEQLASVDTLVFDIQDIGARFYTYISTMGLAMEVAAESGLDFVVLDRPNPIGGQVVAGPMLDAGSESFVAYHSLPVRHGMTVGELAQMFRAERDLDLELEVIRTENWQREQLWDATGLTWINPSPNMRSLTEALLYPGIGLLETTNLSVGRGTDTPFELIGAPWMDGQQLAEELHRANLPGVTFVPIRFTPDATKFANEECEGINIVITNWQTFQSVRTGLEVACTLRRLYPDDWDMKHFPRLLGNQAVFDAIRAGQGIDQIEDQYRPALEEFFPRRQKFLLY